MTKTLRIVAAALTLLVVSGAEAKAQEWFWGMEYMVGIPTSDTKGFTNDFSWRNFGIEGRYSMTNNVSLGLFFGWNVFTEQTDSVISFEGIDVSGDQFRYVNSFPIMATAHYYLGRPGGIRPYAGVGLGTYYIENRLDIGLSSITTSRTGWTSGSAASRRRTGTWGWPRRSVSSSRWTGTCGRFSTPGTTGRSSRAA
jgi:opacity protein-like surface antigen